MPRFHQAVLGILCTRRVRYACSTWVDGLSGAEGRDSWQPEIEVRRVVWCCVPGATKLKQCRIRHVSCAQPLHACASRGEALRVVAWQAGASGSGQVNRRCCVLLPNGGASVVLHRDERLANDASDRGERCRSAGSSFGRQSRIFARARQLRGPVPELYLALSPTWRSGVMKIMDMQASTKTPLAIAARGPSVTAGGLIVVKQCDSARRILGGRLLPVPSIYPPGPAAAFAFSSLPTPCYRSRSF